METEATLILDGHEVPIQGERNLLELARKQGIDIPTLCYHAELSVYGACRLCLVEVEGRGIVASCSTQPMAGMRVLTTSEQIRGIRRINLELLLASHGGNCTTCSKNKLCRLQEMARKLGATEVRFARTHVARPLDTSSPSLIRDPNKCILCGDCVRMCREVQGVSAIDFAYRGRESQVIPGLGKGLGEVDCVHCGQCSRVCPTAAIAPRSSVQAVWSALADPSKRVVAQIAPAVRSALGEMFSGLPDDVATGRIVAALKLLGFDKVYDTCFAADLTVMEEGRELLGRLETGRRLPLFTSCCPAWVNYAERNLPAVVPHLSTCKSPQQMFGSLAKHVLPELLGDNRREIVVVAIMPCTAKKAEAQLAKFRTKQGPDVDHVLTTMELGRMIDERGLRFDRLAPASLDSVLGHKTGAGVLFGASGGVTEAVLRMLVGREGKPGERRLEFLEVRGEAGLRESSIRVGEATLRVAVVHGLENARRLCKRVEGGDAAYDFVEVMACPGGCIGGAGQPTNLALDGLRHRARALQDCDRSLAHRSSEENAPLRTLYQEFLGEPGSEEAHRLLHTHHARWSESALATALPTGEKELAAVATPRPVKEAPLWAGAPGAE